MSHELSKEEKLKKILIKANWGDHFIEEQLQKYPEDDAIYNLIFFDISFAKAYWGEEEIKTHITDDGKEWLELVEAGWKYHQHQLLTEIQEGRDPIDYLYKFI